MKKMSYQSPLGPMTILADNEYLYGLWFNDQKYFGSSYAMHEIEIGTTSMGTKTKEWLDDYFAGKHPSIRSLNLYLKATPFREKVYKALKTVPYGKTITYKGLSDLMQEEESAPKNLSRAIGSAVGRNPILLIIPCHRVIGSDGSLTGYAGGLKRKEELLKLEGIHV